MARGWLINMPTTLLPAVLLCACVSAPAQREVPQRVSQEFISIQIGDETLYCFDAELTEQGAAVFDRSVPEEMRDGKQMACEVLQFYDFAPCRVKLPEEAGGEAKVWCAYPPGMLWQQHGVPQSSPHGGVPGTEQSL